MEVHKGVAIHLNIVMKSIQPNSKYTAADISKSLTILKTLKSASDTGDLLINAVWAKMPPIQNTNIMSLTLIRGLRSLKPEQAGGSGQAGRLSIMAALAMVTVAMSFVQS